MNIFDLTSRLSQALDQNYDVIDMDAVIGVISSLEGTTITKEQLETTRLAKYINQLRRRTGSEPLARRAKSLLKKWREMVRIQANEPTTSNVSTAVANDNVAETTTITNLQHHRSQPTSPIAGGSINLESVIHSKANSHVDFLRSTVSNPAVSFLTRSASLNVHNSNKRLENAEKQMDATCTSSSAAPIIDNEKQHTSFANLIKGFSNDNGIISDTTKTNTPAPRNNPARKPIKMFDIAKPTETFIIDQSSNSSSQLSCTPSSVTSVAPIVIDIQDSNSGSNLITTASASASLTKSALDSSTLVSPTKVALPAAVLYSSTSLKFKRSKKEKKRRERGTESTSLFRSTITNVMVSEEVSLNQQQQQTSIDDLKFIPIIEDKSRIGFPPTNVSEILSLSNSSVSSMFPTVDGASRAMENKNISNMGTSSNRTTISTSDLTFAGKFKQQSDLASAATSFTNSDLIGFKDRDLNCITSPNASSKVSQLSGTPNIVTIKFMPFSGSGGGCNSNDSTSNSRASHFEVVDVVSQDNNQSKIIEELRLQKKQDASANTFVQENATLDNCLSTQTMSLLTVPQKHIVDIAETNAAEASTNPDKKIPKKRGRKKGSKGVDSVIAKETSLSSQMLITSLGSGCKKVKTTRELYAEMQNRKLGISTSTSSPKMTNWSQQQLSSQPESSCSEPSLHSPRTLDACSTNATMSTVATRSTPDKYLTTTRADGAGSDSDTITSEPSRDSIAAQKIIKRGISVESNSNSQLPPSKIIESNKQLAVALTTATIEKQLRELLKQLPLVPNLRSIELGCSVDLVPCTCKITEILPEPKYEDIIEENDSESKQNHLLTTESATKESDNEKKQPPAVISIIVVNEEISNKSQVTEANKPLAQKPKKSIFDLDFEDDEDPLHTLKAENAAALDASSASMEWDCAPQQKPVEDAEQQLKMQINESFEPILQMQPSAPISEPDPLHIFPSYQVNEDPECVAKQRFEIQTQKICQFHINALHNCYVANVNGNWDNADTPKFTMNSIENYDKSAENCFNNSVVPMYGSLINERIRKDLMHVNFTKNFTPKKQSTTMVSDNYMPFLGVSRRFQQFRRNTEHMHSKFTANNILVDNQILNITEEDNRNTTNPKAVKCKTATCNLNSNETTLLNNVSKENITDKIFEAGHNILLKDITIDISEPQSSVKTLGNVKISTETAEDIVLPKSQNLLAIVEDLNFINNNISPIGYTNTSSKIFNKQNEISNTKCNPSIEISEVDKSTTLIVSSPSHHSTSIKTDESSSTDLASGRRRSSSCSNTSLKQTQQSINQKLRRRREKQKLTEFNQISKKRRQPYFKESESESKKPRIIKRIKIAINGDIATHRQISLGNNSTDDDNDNEQPCTEEEDDNDFDNDMNSVGSRNSLLEVEDEYSIVDNNGGETDVVFVEDEDEPEAYDDDDVDFDEDDEYYSGDFHEVVTRDISATSTGNNHIVLTIKKTPSKTNSPSNSLSAISPVITSNAAPAATSNTLCSDASRIALKLQPHMDADVLNQQQRNDITSEMNKASFGNFTLTEREFKDAAAIGLTAKEYDCIKNQFSPGTSNHSLKLSSAITPSHNRIDGGNDNVSSLQERMLQLGCTLRKRKRRMRRKVKNLKPFRFPENVETGNCAIANSNKKLHHQLFFPHEICNRQDGIRENILNITSCSSSCAEESEFEYYTSASEYEDTTSAAKSKEFKFQHVDNKINLVSYSNTHLTNLFNPSADTSLSAPAKAMPVNTKISTSSETNENHKTNIANTNLKNEDNNNGNIKIEPSKKIGEEQVNEDMLPKENNGLLLSFNNIYRASDVLKENVSAAGNKQVDRLIMTVDEDDVNGGKGEGGDDYSRPGQEVLLQAEKQLEQQLPKKNCDDYNNLYNNNNNFNLIKYNRNKDSLESNDYSCRLSYKHSSNSDVNNDKSINSATDYPQLLPHKEYRTGLRAVDEDVDDEDGNNCARIQQFKEWHQVLQLRSYNDELLTVLPYVVLE